MLAHTRNNDVQYSTVQYSTVQYSIRCMHGSTGWYGLIFSIYIVVNVPSGCARPHTHPPRTRRSGAPRPIDAHGALHRGAAVGRKPSCPAATCPRAVAPTPRPHRCCCCCCWMEQQQLLWLLLLWLQLLLLLVLVLCCGSWCYFCVGRMHRIE
jgi:hypothetical protein